MIALSPLQHEDLNPNQARGGANLPHKFSNAYSSGTESRLDLKPGCKFEFIRWPEVKGKVSKIPEGRSLKFVAKILKRTCTPLKLRATFKTPHKFSEQNMDPPKLKQKLC